MDSKNAKCPCLASENSSTKKTIAFLFPDSSRIHTKHYHTTCLACKKRFINICKTAWKFIVFLENNKLDSTPSNSKEMMSNTKTDTLNLVWRQWVCLLWAWLYWISILYTHSPPSICCVYLDHAWLDVHSNWDLLLAIFCCGAICMT